MRKTYGTLGVLFIVLVLGLILAAGPAMAGGPFAGNPPGSMWGGHEVNGKFTYVRDDPGGAIVFDLVASDSRVSGTLRVYVDFAGTTSDGIFEVWGHGDLVTADGSWHLDYYRQVFHKNALVDKPAQATVLLGDFVGAEDSPYEDLVFRSANHTGGGLNAPYIFKGWIYSTE